MTDPNKPQSPQRNRSLIAFRREWLLLLIVAYLILVTWPLLYADFGMIDDHEIMLFLGPANSVKVADIPRLLQMRFLETNGRFRPGYYLLRIGETLFWGGHPRLWYADRILLAILTAICIYYVCRTFIPPVCTAVATLLFFAGPQSEIWYRLGTCETYGIAILSLGLAWLTARWKHRGDPGGIGPSKIRRPMTLLPPLLLIASTGFLKESFIPILPALLLFLYVVLPFFIQSTTNMAADTSRVTQPHHTDRDVYHLGDFLVLLLLAVIFVTQAAGTLFMMIKYGHVYAGRYSTAGLKLAAQQSLLQYSRDTAWFVPMIAAMIQGLLMIVVRFSSKYLRARAGKSLTGQTAAGRDMIALLALLLCGMLLFLVPQWIIYGTTGFGIGGRYLTPGNCFAVYSIVLGWWFLLRHARPWQARVWKIGIVGSLLILVVLKGMDFYHWSAAFAASTRQFQDRLAKVVDLKKRYPQSPLIFTIDNVAAYEPIVSVQRFLAVRLRSWDRPLLIVPKWDTSRAAPLEKVLAERLTLIAAEGNPSFRGASKTPIDRNSCIEVSFSGPGQPSLCRRSVNIFRD